MKESLLWKHLSPELKLAGAKFQKISDRFTPGIPDVLGMHNSTGHAWELKELKGVRILRMKFRPGQLDWLRDWEQSGGVSFIISTHGQRVYIHGWSYGEELELSGMSPGRIEDTAWLAWTKDRKNHWRELITQLLSCYKFSFPNLTVEP